MRHVLRPACVPLVAVVSIGCSVSNENPFVGTFRMRPPSASCDVLFSGNLYGTQADAPLEIYCLDIAGGVPERLTYCTAGTEPCSLVEAAAALDAHRLVARQVVGDTNEDGRLAEDDGVALTFLDLARGATAQLVARGGSLYGLDWSPGQDLITYSAAGAGGLPDLFGIDLTDPFRTPVNWTGTEATAERQPRFDGSGAYILYESAGGGGNSRVWVASFSGVSQALTVSEPEGTRLAGTPYLVGAHATPMMSPDDQFVVFRRLVSAATGSQGLWELLTVSTVDLSVPTVIVAGEAFRSAPDWGREGILFCEIDPETARSSLVLTDGAGGQRRTLLAVEATQRISAPRWFHRAR